MKHDRKANQDWSRIVFALTILIALCALIVPRAIAPTSTSITPTINTTFVETVVTNTDTIIDVKTGALIPVENRLEDGTILVLDVTQARTILAKSLLGLADAAYKFSITAADLSGNRGTYNYSFDVKYPGQIIEVLEPRFGGTRSRIVNLTITSEFSSECRYNDTAAVVTTAAAFATMRPFPEQMGNNTTHRVQDVLTVLGRETVAANVIVPISIACKEANGRITPLKHSITYTPGPPVVCTGADCINPVPMQDIALIIPAKNVMTTLTSALTVTSEKTSTCKWNYGDAMITDAQQFAAMRAFQTAANTRTHSVNLFLGNYTRTPAINESVEVVVSCNDGARISSEVFAIIYNPAYTPTGPTYQNLTLLSPINGTTRTTTNVLFSVETERMSTCKYSAQRAAVTTASGYAGMNFFPQTGARVHTLASLYETLRLAPQAELATFIAVTCLENGYYTATVFTVNYQPGTITPPKPPTPTIQDIKLIIPKNGVTNVTNGPLIIESERTSTCKWDQGSAMITSASGFSAMKSIASVDSAKRSHTQLNFYGALAKVPTKNETISVVVSCDDTTIISSEVFAITYNPDFTTPSPEYQELELKSPPLGTTTTTTNVLVSIGSERPSVCKYALQSQPVTTKAGYDTMKSFPAGQTGALTHSIPDFYRTVAITPTGPTATSIAVTCLSNGFYTSSVFVINFRPIIGDPALTYQDLMLITPVNGMTNTQSGPLTIESERTSTCKWDVGSAMIKDKTRFGTMKALPASDPAKKIHTIPNLFTALGYSPAKNETISVVITCDDSTLLSSEVFSITYNPDFTPGPNYQNLVLTSPPLGTTATTIGVTFTVESERTSVCKYALQSQAVTLKSGYDAMKSFPTGQTGALTHSIPDFYRTNSLNPTAATATNVAVTCLSNGFYTSAVFVINYRPNPVDPLSPVLNAIVVTDIDNPVAYITVKSDQDVWCAIDDVPMTGAKTFNNFNKTVSGNYTEARGSNVTNRTVNICCQNRGELEACFDQIIVYRFSNPAKITVTSAATTNNATYYLKFVTDTIARCTVRAAAPLTLSPAATVLASEFVSVGVPVQSGVTTFNIECTSEVGTKTSITYNLTADRTAPVLSDIIVQGKTCDTKQVFFTFNATDPEPSSKIAAYQYTLINSTGGALTLPTNSSSASVTARNLKLVVGTDLKISARVWDGAGNPSVVRDEVIKITDDSDTTCDKFPPEVRVVQIQYGLKTNATLLCTDDGSGCAGTFRYSLLPVNQSGTCTVSNNSPSVPLTQMVVVDKESYFCYLVPDKAGNELRGQARILINKTSVLGGPPIISNITNGTCTDSIKNRDESGVDCGGYACGVLLGKKCANNVTCISGIDCISGTCTAGICGGVSCTNEIKDGTESDIDCGGTCGACTEGKFCTATADCVRGTRCVNDLCSSPSETNDPSTPKDDLPLPEQSGGNIWKLLIIALGVMLLLGGVGGAVLYDPQAGVPRSSSPGLAAFRSGMNETTGRFNEPIARFAAPGQEHGNEISSTAPVQADSPREAKRKRDAERKAERDQTVKAFETAGDLTAVTHITHSHIEQAAKDLPPKELVKAVKTLATEERVTQKDASIAILDLQHSAVGDEHDDAIEALREHFNLPQTTIDKTSTIKVEKKK